MVTSPHIVLKSSFEETATSLFFSPPPLSLYLVTKHLLHKRLSPFCCCFPCVTVPPCVTIMIGCSLPQMTSPYIKTWHSLRPVYQIAQDVGTGRDTPCVTAVWWGTRVMWGMSTTPPHDCDKCLRVCQVDIASYSATQQRKACHPPRLLFTLCFHCFVLSIFRSFILYIFLFFCLFV